MALFRRIKSSGAGNRPEHEIPIATELRSAGDALRQQREALGLDISQVSAGLKIKPAYLVAIEEGRTDVLPGAAYAAGFVRAYSTYLGLDNAEILRRFKFEASGFDAKPDLSFPMPLGEHSMPGGGMVLVGLMLTIGVYATWYYWFDAERTRPERVIEVPATLLPSAIKLPKSPAVPVPASPPPVVGGSISVATKIGPGPTQTTLAAKAPTVSTHVPATSEISAVPAFPSLSANSSSIPPASAPFTPSGATVAAAPTPAPGATMPASLPAAANPTQALAAPLPLPNGRSARVYGAVEGPARILLHATADSWIQIRGADRTVLFSGLLKPGDTYRVPDQPGLSMRAGNAGGLDIVVDGKPAPSLGSMGSVRNVALDPQSLEAEGGVHD
jgi:cytoskeleton protein RodZ